MTYYALEPGHRPASDLKLDGAYVLVCGVNFISFPGVIYQFRASDVCRSLNDITGGVCQMVQWVSDRNTAVSNLSPILLRSKGRGRIMVTDDEPSTDFAKSGFVFTDFKNFLQNLSVRTDMGYGFEPDSSMIITKNFHSHLRVELQGGKKLSFDGTPVRKVRLD